jgi:ATP-binding cassette subfamily B protein
MSEAKSQTEAKRKRTSLSALRPLLPYARRRAGRIAAAFAALLAASLATLVVPYAIRQMVDRGFHGGAAGSVHTWFALLIGVTAALALASAARYYLVMTIGERIVADLRGDFFRHLTTLDQTFFDSEKTGEIVSRLSADTTQLKSTFGSSASVALRNVFMFVGAISLMAATSLRLSAYVLVAIPLIVLPL